ncbi:MAG: phage terminase large subunit [Candidatus Hodarchaeales archaeon]|jgi:hypothetical protein
MNRRELLKSGLVLPLAGLAAAKNSHEIGGRLMPDGLTVKPTPTQEAFLASLARYPGFVGGWGRGKTMWMLLKGFALSEKYPGNQGIFFRKNFTDLRDSTMADFTRYTGLKVRSDKTVTLDNGSRILFHHLDELAGVAQNINLGWFGIEQAEELESDQVFQTLRGRLRRDNVGIHQGIVIANTNGHNWIWRLWKQGQLAQSELFEMTPFENPYLPEDFIADLKQMESESPSHYRRFVLNSWEDTDTADKCIPYQKILDAVGRDLREYGDSLRVISCDPAEYGDDKSVIYVLDGLEVVDQKIMTKRSLGETSGNIIKFHRKYGADQIVVDDVGVGAGVRKDMREELDPYNDEGLIVPFNSGRTAQDRQHYVRMRDEMWGHGAKLFMDDYVSIPVDNDLVEELAAHTYSLNSKGQYMVCRKKDVKKELGHSPDRAEALLMGLWCAKKGHKRELAGMTAKKDEEDYDPLTWEME